MTLKFTYESADLIPEGKESLYEKQDNGGYKLAVEGAVEKSRLDEFRDNNTKLRNQVDEVNTARNEISEQFKQLQETKAALEKQFEGVDLDEFKSMKQKQQELADKKLIEEGKVEELIAERVNKANEASSNKLSSVESQYKETIEKLNSQIQSQTSQLNTLLIDNEIANAATKHSVAKTALEDVMNRGRSLFELEEGKAVAKQDGKVMYTEDQVTPLTIERWVNNLSENAPHLFEKSAGAGARQPQGRGGANTGDMTATDKISAGLKTMAKQ